MIRPELDRRVLAFFSAGLWIKHLLDGLCIKHLLDICKSNQVDIMAG